MLMRRKASRRHGATGPPPPYIFLGSTLPPLASHAFAFLAVVKLCPLQSFFPLQSWLALLQLPFPLQSFVPSQWTPFIALLLAAKATAGAINVASAPAIATPFNVPFFMGTLLRGDRPSAAAIRYARVPGKVSPLLKGPKRAAVSKGRRRAGSR